jgi:hypothetical protein
LHRGTGIESRASPAGNVALTTVIPLGTEEGVFFSRFIADTKSKKAKNLKPCSRTTQFFAGLHCQARNQHRTELMGGGVFSVLHDEIGRKMETHM